MGAWLIVLAVSMLVSASAQVTTLANFPSSMIYAVQTDAAGNIYVAGFQGTFTKASPFVAKLSPTGQTLYSSTLAGSNFGIAFAIAVDSSGAAYVFGNTNSPDFPVTAGALQTTMQGAFQGFVTKLDAGGKIVYSTFVGGATDVTPGISTAPGLNSILVDSAGDAIITGQAGTNSTIGPFPPAPALSVSDSESFVLKLDPAGARILAGILGLGGMIAMDGQGNIYVAGLQYGNQQSPLAVTANAFQSEPKNVCGLLGAFFTCGYQYVAKLNAGLNQILYATYVGGEYGATPTAISVDPQGDVFIAGNTNSPNYPTTLNAYEPQYIASAAPPTNCFFMPNCVNLPPASGYLTEVNPTGTGLVYSSYFSGTQTDSINFAAFNANAIYLGGNAGSANLPGFAGYPQQCLPQMYETRLSADGREIGASRVAPGKVLAYDAFAGTLIATNGTNVMAIDPNATQTPVACILDAADLKPVTSVAPGELLSLFGEFSPGSATVKVNGVPSALLYADREQINFKAPFGIAGGAQVNIQFASAFSNISDSLTLPIVASNPAAFLNTAIPSAALMTCTLGSAASVNGLLLLAFNPDGSVNTCLNPVPAGSIVTLFLNGLGVTSAPVVSAVGATVVSVLAVPGAISGVWQLSIRIPANASSGGTQISLAAGGMPVRDANLIVWVK